MRVYIIFNKPTKDLLFRLGVTKLHGEISIHKVYEINDVLSEFKEGDTLVVSSIDVFDGAIELYYALNLISSISKGNFISLKEELFRIDSGCVEKELLKAVSLGVKLEEAWLKKLENCKEDDKKKLEFLHMLKTMSMSILKGELKIKDIIQ
ncbi:hypothetical protein [Clostridium sp. C2-6-12]|uniref:hypothetical protein n=1 Tax=Clostridium sp. C2-6-12 TaxID=2698832 RepID=UPI00136890F8|nr:hypothetical protein [Clostridium sp. C2-6-12]